MSAQGVKEPLLLLIENDEADIFLFRRALSQLAFKGQVRVVGSVSEARRYLEGTGPFSDRNYYPLPDLIVSDMNLPGLTGNHFLEWMRSDSRYCFIPFVFLSGSFLPADRSQAVSLGSEGFFVKTGDIIAMKERVQSILKFLPRSFTILPEARTGALGELPRTEPMGGSAETPDG